MLCFYISSIKTNQMWQKVHFFTGQWQFEVIYKIFCHFGIFFWDLRSRVPALFYALQMDKKFITNLFLVYWVLQFYTNNPFLRSPLHKSQAPTTWPP